MSSIRDKRTYHQFPGTVITEYLSRSVELEAVLFKEGQVKTSASSVHHLPVMPLEAGWARTVSWKPFSTYLQELSYRNNRVASRGSWDTLDCSKWVIFFLKFHSQPLLSCNTCPWGSGLKLVLKWVSQLTRQHWSFSHWFFLFCFQCFTPLKKINCLKVCKIEDC